MQSVCLKLPILNFIYAIHSSHQPILALSAKDPFLLMLVHLLLIESMWDTQSSCRYFMQVSLSHQP